MMASTSAYTSEGEAKPVPTNNKLYQLAMSGNAAKLEKALRAGKLTQPKSYLGACLLSTAAWEGHREIAALLLRYGVPVDSLIADEVQPIILAGHGGRGVVEILLDNRASVDAKTNTGKQGLHMAARWGNPDAAATLLERRANIDCGFADGGWQPIHEASVAGHVAVVQLLLDRAASPDSPNAFGARSLDAAADNGHPDVVALLLDRGASPEVSCFDGVCPRVRARIQGHKECERILKDFEDAATLRASAVEHHAKGSVSEALEVYQQLREGYSALGMPRSAAEVCVDMSECQSLLGLHQQCASSCQQALKIRPFLARVAIVKERLQKALRVLVATREDAPIEVERCRESSNTVPKEIARTSPTQAEMAARFHRTAISYRDRPAIVSCDLDSLDAEDGERIRATLFKRYEMLVAAAQLVDCENECQRAVIESATADLSSAAIWASDTRGRELARNKASSKRVAITLQPERTKPPPNASELDDEASNEVALGDAETSTAASTTPTAGPTVLEETDEVSKESPLDDARIAQNDAVCIICLENDAELVGKSCGHLAWCKRCRRIAVHGVLQRNQRSSKKLDSKTLERTAVACPCCRVTSCIVNIKRCSLPETELYIPLRRSDV